MEGRKVIRKPDEIRAKVFEIISGRPQAWISSREIASALMLEMEDIVDALQGLSEEKLIEVWLKAPCGVSWALTPYAAAVLGIVLDDYGHSWVPEDRKKPKLKNRSKVKTFVFSEGEYNEFEFVDKKTFEPERELSASEELVYELGGEEQFRKLQEFKRRGPRRIKFPAPRNLLGSNRTWPVDGQDRQSGPRTEYVTQTETCQNCGGNPGTFGYCLCCDAFGLDSLIPAISEFTIQQNEWKKVKEAIEARKARKKQRREKKAKKVETEIVPIGEVS